MKQNINLVVFLLVLCFFQIKNVTGQRFLPINNLHFKGGSLIYLQDATYSSSRDLYLAGMFEGTLEIADSLIHSKRNSSLFIALQDTSGSCKVSETFHCSGNSGIISLHSNRQGEIILTAWFTDSLFVNRAFFSHKGLDIICIKLNPQLEIMNSTILLESFPGRIMCMHTDLAGNIFLAGRLNKPYFLAGNLFTPEAKQDGIILKYDSDKVLKDVKLLSGSGECSIEHLKCFGKNLYLTGNFTREMYINDSLHISNNKKDVFVVSMNEDLEILGSFSFGSYKNDLIADMEIDHFGNIYLCGSTNGPFFSMKTSDRYQSGTDIYFMKMDTLLNTKWLRFLGSAFNDRGLSIETDYSQRIFLSGVYKSSLILSKDTLNTNHRFYNGFLACFSDDGQYLWAYNLESSSEVFPSILKSDKNFGLALGGSFHRDMYIGTSEIKSEENPDVFVSTFKDPCYQLHFNLPDKQVLCQGLIDTLDAGPGFLLYDWNDGLSSHQWITISNPGSYKIEITDQHGCIATDTIHVVLDSIMVTANVVDEILPEGNNGIIDLDIFSGIPPYKVTWDDGHYGPFRENLVAGNYTFEVIDSLGCKYTDQIQVAQILGTEMLQLEAFPNPLDALTRIIYSLPDNTWMEMSVYDNTGRKVQILFSGFQNKGSHEIEWKPIELKPGIYTIQLSTKEEIINKNILIYKE